MPMKIIGVISTMLNEIFIKKNYDAVLNYRNFCPGAIFNTVKSDHIIYFLKFAPLNILSYFVANINPNCVLDATDSGDIIHYICSYASYPEIIDLILKKYPRLINSANNIIESTPLIDVCANANVNHTDLPIRLVDMNANVNYCDISGKTPLHYLCKTSNFSSIIYLIESGANIHAKDINHNLPLHYAAAHSSLEVINYLVSYGCDLYEKNNRCFNAHSIMMFRDNRPEGTKYDGYTLSFAEFFRNKRRKINNIIY